MRRALNVLSEVAPAWLLSHTRMSSSLRETNMGRDSGIATWEMPIEYHMDPGMGQAPGATRNG